ncbi:MAG: hypothetical protein COV10_03510 [Candidatus Vogelbacteria bacterium CG10_big_fil_rev_8_21_14_0_10_51_16]|uniref:Uncharacterized protein n=1 Tax=Candidatus Vogelbacteria bacterium CG10_big_fil_rev_8_21_14_0_10_51_16 TaxID=1975045 RepID=A0A2H0RFV0_9BACT|nr:MAG: hypothetical protein COV10_03510 [Candidatus Vogelbacteria bacterium CG10_big_fil_rev_8_21_14_0_10_51_16]
MTTRDSTVERKMVEAVRKTLIESMQGIFGDPEFQTSLRLEAERRLLNFRRKQKGTRNSLRAISRKT